MDHTATDEQLQQLGIPPAGLRLIERARQEAPVRRVHSSGTSIITHFASRKMQRSIATESRTAEYPLALALETDPQVLEYYPQPCTLKLDLLDKDTGEIHCLDHTPDFLVIYRTHVVLQEVKTEDKLMRLAQRQPWRYVKRAQRWCSPLIEEHLTEVGIAYEVHSNAEIHPNFTKNWETLEDYLDPGTPECSAQTLGRVQALLDEHGMMSLRELLEPPLDFTADMLNAAIVRGHLTCDLNDALLSEPDNFLLYRDSTFMQFQSAVRSACAHDERDTFSLALTPGTRFVYEGTPMQISLVGENEVLCRNLEQATDVQLRKDWLLNAHGQGLLQQIAAAPNDALDVHALVRYPKRDLDTAQERTRWLELPYDSRHSPVSRTTFYRLQKLQAKASHSNTPHVLALVPRNVDKGNRRARLNAAQHAAMEHVHKAYYSANHAPNGKSAYRQLQALCAEQQLTSPSYPTFLKYLKSQGDAASVRTRYGRRLQYQRKPFYYTLAYDTPRHGVRPFECVHMDHTLLDIELRSQRTGKSMGRPWLTLITDAYSRRGMYALLSFTPPDRTTTLLALRGFVKRWGRLPNMLMVDNGKDLVSQDVQNFLVSMNVHLRQRPAAEPRAGAVMERLFGTVNTAFVHNLAGNTKLMRDVRSVSGTHLPQRLALWNLAHLSAALQYWLHTIYDEQHHSALDESPRQAFERGMLSMGDRSHRAIAYNLNLIIATSPSVNRQGERTIDRQRGVKVNNFYYQCPAFDSIEPKGKYPVRYDPCDVSRVFVQLHQGQWVQAVSSQLRHLPRLNMRQLQAISAEYLKAHRNIKRQDDIAGTQLLAFIATMKPNDGFEADMQRIAETECLHARSGLLSPEVDETPNRVFGMQSLATEAQELASGLSLLRGQHVSAGGDGGYRAETSTPTQPFGGSGNGFDFGDLT